MAKEKRTSEEQYRYMTETPAGKLILSFSVPSILTQLVSSIYNLSDTFFVGKIGTSATAAVGVCFSLNMVMLAMGFWAGSGASMLVSHAMGAQDQPTAQKLTSSAFWLSTFFGLIVTLAVIAGGDSLMLFLGATDTILPYARDYAFFIALGAPFNCSTLMLGQSLRAEGLSKESMYGNVAGAVINIVLDPIFIFTLNMGIRGAALATFLSQFIGWAILLSNYLRKKTQLSLSIRYVSRKINDYLMIFKYGFPSLCRHVCNTAANIVLNNVSGVWGDASIAAMSICSRILHVSNAVSLGFVNGCQPVIGYAFGNKDKKRIQEAFNYVSKVVILSMIGFGVVALAFAPGLIGLFRDDNKVILYGTSALRMIAVALPFASINNICSTSFQLMKKPIYSSIVTFGRQIALYVPFLLILPGFMEVYGVQAAGPLADVIMGLIAMPLTIRYINRLSFDKERTGQ